MQDQNPRKALGQFYTPDWLADWMVRQISPASTTLRILDPACGDGALLMAMARRWTDENCVGNCSPASASARIQWIRASLFGVDVDPPAVARARQRLAQWVMSGTHSGGETISEDVANVLTENIRIGDALSGPTWNAPGEVSSGDDCPGFSWSEAFPAAAAHGGFDCVIANPPYRRERDSKLHLDELRGTELNSRRGLRTDLWHLFLHRSLDLLRPVGRLVFLVNSYWGQSQGAAPIRARLAAEGSLVELTSFGGAGIFADVSGRHMVMRFQKGDLNRLCEIRDYAGRTVPEIQASLVASEPAARLVPQSALWNQGQLSLEEPCELDQWGDHTVSLDSQFEVRQGIAENPPFVTRAVARALGDPGLVGRGVFVLTAKEVEALSLGPREVSVLRPYFALTSVRPLELVGDATHQLLYLTRHTAPDLDALPRIRDHLAPFRSLLEQRREVRTGAIAWWHLHWPRQERLFLEPRIIGLQMARVPTFAWVQRPAFVGFSAQVILERAVEPPPAGTVRLTLRALCALLSSPQGRRWFESWAKWRGAHLDIGGSVLRKFPIPSLLSATQNQALEAALRCGGGSAGELEEIVRDVYRDPLSV